MHLESFYGYIGKVYILRFLFLTYGIFLTGFFFILNAVDHYKFFSIAVLAPGILLLPRARALLRNSGQHLFLLIVLYLAYMLATALWSESFDLEKFLDYLRLALYILMFLLVTVILAKEYPDKFDLFLKFVCATAGVAAIVSMAIWYQDHPFPRSRIIGIGTLENPNASAMVYGVFAVMSAGYALISRQWYERLTFILLAFILLGFVWFTQSRGTLIASVVAISVFVLLERPKKAIIMFLLTGGGLGVLFVVFPDIVQTAVKRSLIVRPEVWGIIIDKVSAAPYFGYGYLSNEYVFSPTAKTHLFAHNAYLASLRDGGVLGLSLMLAMLGYACRLAYLQGKDNRNYVFLAMLAFGMTIMLFDMDRLVTRPRELWAALWFPLAMIMSHGVNSQNILHREEASLENTTPE